MTNASEIRIAMQTARNPNLYRRMEAVALRGEGKNNQEIAEITKFNAKYVSQLVALYVNKGLSALSEEGRKGGNNRNLSVDQEREFFEQFRQEAVKRHIITPAEIKAA